MRFQMTERWPALTDTFVVKDEDGRLCYTVKEKGLSLRETLNIRDAGGRVVATLKAPLIGSGYRLAVHGDDVAAISGGARPDAVLLGEKGHVQVFGDVSGREFVLRRDRALIATISRKLFSLTDSYGLEVDDPEDELLAIGIAIALHRLTAEKG